MCIVEFDDAELKITANLIKQRTESIVDAHDEAWIMSIYTC